MYSSTIYLLYLAVLAASIVFPLHLDLRNCF